MKIRIKYNRRLIESGEAIYIGRGFRYHNVPRSKWCNPYSVKKYGREKSIKLFEQYLTKGEGKHLLNDLHELHGKLICCHCEVDENCHGDVLMKLITTNT